MNTHLFGVTAFGLLIGFMMGMSASPVVGSALAVFVGAAIVFTGLEKPATGGRARPGDWVSRAVGAFSIAMLLALMAGVLARTHNWFGKSLKSFKAELKEAGIPEEEMKPYLLAFLAFSPATEEAPEVIKPLPFDRGVLFSSLNDDVLGDVRPSNFASPVEALADWAERPGPLAEMAKIIRQVPAEKQKDALEQAHKFLRAAKTRPE